MDRNMRKLYLIRGVSGAGKTSFADTLFGVFQISADQYFEDDDGRYNFDVNKLHQAHKWCQEKTEKLMKAGYELAVANTFTTTKEMKPYYKLAEKYGYRVFSIIVENRHGGKDVHNVPEATLEKQEKRFNIKLR